MSVLVPFLSILFLLTATDVRMVVAFQIIPSDMDKYDQKPEAQKWGW